MGHFGSSIFRVACAISGGVDSAVSALLLKNKGFNVLGVFMKNWDVYDETLQCSSDIDREDAQMVCHKLGLEFCELNFVKEYWNDVFMPTVDAYSDGLTPNPDVLCNRFVKFQKLSSLLPKLNCDAFATGHYAQNSFGNFLERRDIMPDSSYPALLRAADPVKDQTFWLCTISAQQLRNCMFPVGNLLKPQVKQIAKDAGLERIAARRESMGICFIGKRKFREFIDKYIDPKPGVFKNLETGDILGEHTGVHHFTVGQRVPGITKGQIPFYIAKLSSSSQEILVVQGASHPALFMRRCWTEPAFWLSGRPPLLPSSDYLLQWQNKWRAVPSSIELDPELMEGLRISLQKPMRCITSGQFAAFYHGNVCLGGAQIRKSASLADEGRTERYYDWHLSEVELQYLQKT